MPAKIVTALVAMVAIVCAFSSSAAAQTSSTVAGTIKDAQGGLIPRDRQPRRAHGRR